MSSKINQLLQQAVMFEKLAVSGNTKTFLKSLADFPAPPIDLGGMMEGKQLNSPIHELDTPQSQYGYPKIDPKVQKYLNQYGEGTGFFFNLDVDGKLGPKTQQALDHWKTLNSPASSNERAIKEISDKIYHPKSINLKWDQDQKEDDAMKNLNLAKNSK